VALATHSAVIQAKCQLLHTGLCDGLESDRSTLCGLRDAWVIQLVVLVSIQGAEPAELVDPAFLPAGADRNVRTTREQSPAGATENVLMLRGRRSAMMAAGDDEIATVSQRQQAFAEMLQALARPEAFPRGQPNDTTRVSASEGDSSGHGGSVNGQEQIEIVQTHASAVLLAGDRAYKLKKPNDFGFFDYSTATLRRHFCGEEVRLNSRLAPAIYLGVAPVLALPDGSFRFAREYAPDATPAPGASLDGGRVVDYAVVMVRLPEEATLEARVLTDGVRPEMIVAVAERVAAFHSMSRTDDRVAHFGSLDVIEHNWVENFEQMGPYIGRALDSATFDRINAYIGAFLRQRHTLFETRVHTGRIRDCHGDLRMQHIYFLDHPSLASESAASPDALAIIDCIEFNERFRFGDVAGEIAFLTMELDAVGRPDIARAFTDAYVARAGDESLRELLPFYACYRACVRGKVMAFQLDEPEVPPDQRDQAQREARKVFTLAARYASRPAAPMLLLTGGLMGVGKSTLARRLAHEQGWALLSSDTIRKELAGVAPTLPQDQPYGQGIYSQHWTARTYRTMLERAAATLAEGRSVILDASFARATDRRAAARLAVQVGADAWFIECVCPREVALARLSSRWRRKQDSAGGVRLAAELRAASAALDASDGRPALYDEQAAAWQPFDGATEPDVAQVCVDTGGSAAASVAQVMDALDSQLVVCWLSEDSL